MSDTVQLKEHFCRFVETCKKNCCTNGDELDVEGQHEENQEEACPYYTLMNDLIMRYKNDLDAAEEADVDIADQFNRLTREVKDVKQLLGKCD